MGLIPDAVIEDVGYCSTADLEASEDKQLNV